jgi:hypothetical protein
MMVVQATTVARPVQSDPVEVRQAAKSLEYYEDYDEDYEDYNRGAAGPELEPEPPPQLQPKPAILAAPATTVARPVQLVPVVDRQAARSLESERGAAGLEPEPPPQPVSVDDSQATRSLEEERRAAGLEPEPPPLLHPQLYDKPAILAAPATTVARPVQPEPVMVRQAARSLEDERGAAGLEPEPPPPQLPRQLQIQPVMMAALATTLARPLQSAPNEDEQTSSGHDAKLEKAAPGRYLEPEPPPVLLEQFLRMLAVQLAPLLLAQILQMLLQQMPKSQHLQSQLEPEPREEPQLELPESGQTLGGQSEQLGKEDSTFSLHCSSVGNKSVSSKISRKKKEAKSIFDLNFMDFKFLVEVWIFYSIMLAKQPFDNG